MRLCTLKGTTLRVHPLFLLSALLHVLTGQGLMAAAYGLALLLHETGHYWTARRLRLPVSEIELTPFGGAMQIPLSDGLTGWPAFRLAAAGIAVNLLCAGAGAAALRLRLSPFLTYFTLAHLAMLAFNLVPALPLDGGRMVIALLSLHFPRPKVFGILLTAGRCIAGGILGYGGFSLLMGRYRFSWIMLGFYLLYAASLEEKHGASRYLSALYARRYHLEEHTAAPVQQLCARSTMPVYLLLPQLHPTAYHQILVVDDTACTVLGRLDEHDLYTAALHTPTAELGQLLLK